MKKIPINEITSKYNGMKVKVTTANGTISGVFQSFYNAISGSGYGKGITEVFSIYDEKGHTQNISTTHVTEFFVLSI